MTDTQRTETANDLGNYAALLQLLHDWHEAGRASFERQWSSMDYDSYAPKTFKDRKRYIALDEGTSGAFLVDKTDSTIYGIKAYGVPHKGRVIGKLGEVTGAILCQRRWR